MKVRFFRTLKMQCAFILFAVSLIAVSTSTRDHLAITEYNTVIDSTIRSIADPLYRQLPISLNNYSYEIFPPKKPGDHPLLLIRYNPPRYNVVLQNVKLNSIGSIMREGECTIPDQERKWEASCWYKFKDVKISAEGKQGQKFDEKLDITMSVATYKWREPDADGYIWHLWAPWAPGSVEAKPIIAGELSPELQQYLSDNKEEMKRFLEYIASELENKFLDYNKLTSTFNRVLKEQNLDENTSRTLDAPAFYTTSFRSGPSFRSAEIPAFRSAIEDIPITATHNVPKPIFYSSNQPLTQPESIVRMMDAVQTYPQPYQRLRPIYAISDYPRRRVLSRGFDSPVDYSLPQNSNFRQGRIPQPRYTYSVKN